MKINKLNINNVRSYDEEQIEFDEGALLIHGDNGAGKSTILQSLFGGLYQTDMIQYLNSDLTLDNIVRRGEKEAEIELEFTVNNEIYTVNWVIKVSEDENGDLSGRTAKCTLDNNNMEIVEGVTNVQKQIEHILGLDSKSFINSVYVQQGDITRLVNANSDTRSEILDGLLGLNKLDTYIERMKIARREIKKQRDDAKSRLSEQKNRLIDLTDTDDIEDQLSKLKNEKKDISEKINKLTDEIETNKENKRAIEARLEEIIELEEKIEELESDCNRIEKSIDNINFDIKSFKNKIKVIENERETEKDILNEKISNFNSEINDKNEADNIKTILNEKQDELNQMYNETKENKLQKVSTKSEIELKIDNKKSNILNIETQIDNNKNSLSDLEEQEKTKNQELKDIKNNLDNLKDNIDKLCNLLDLENYSSISNLEQELIPEAKENVIQRISNSNRNLGRTEVKFELLENLIDSKVCSICEQKHDDIEFAHDKKDAINLEEQQDKVDSILNQNSNLDKLNNIINKYNSVKKDKSTVENNINSLENKIEDRKEKIESLESDVVDYQDEISDLKDKKKSVTSDINNLEKELIDIENNLNTVNSKIDDVKDIISKFKTIEEINTKIEKLRNNIEHKQELCNEKQDRRDEKEREMEQKEKDIENKKDRKTYKKAYEKLDEKIESKSEEKRKLDKKLSNIRDEIATNKQKLKQIKKTKERCNKLEDDVERLSKDVEESTSSIKSYRTVKKQLRSENIGLLNKYANDIFKSFYHNQTYQELIITEDYDIKLVNSSGVEIEPHLSSGGEGTVISFAIRAGVYKLLSERSGGRTTLPPFILDEPTTFLDNSHVSRLKNVLETIRSWNVTQIFVVSHNEELIQNSDINYTVEKDRADNTSKISKNM